MIIFRWQSGNQELLFCLNIVKVDLHRLLQEGCIIINDINEGKNANQWIEHLPQDGNVRVIHHNEESLMQSLHCVHEHHTMPKGHTHADDQYQI